jgi:cytochrome c553
MDHHLLLQFRSCFISKIISSLIYILIQSFVLMNKKRCSFRVLKIMAIAFILLIDHNFIQAQSTPWKVPESAENVKNPLKHTAYSIRKGRTLFQANCAPCHGITGKGDGPSSAALIPPPADLTKPWEPEDTDGALFYMISKGHKPMPKWKVALNNTQRWELVNYIKTLPNKHK